MERPITIASRFAIAVHMLVLLGRGYEAVATSEWLAGSVGVNPVVVRNITCMLKRAGLVLTQQGVAGATLARGLDEITLLDVYRAVGFDGELFAIHQKPNPACRVGACIQPTLECYFGAAQQAMEQSLQRTTLAQVAGHVDTCQVG